MSKYKIQIEDLVKNITKSNDPEELSNSQLLDIIAKLLESNVLTIDQISRELAQKERGRKDALGLR